MKLRPLILTDETRAEIARVRRFAELHKLPLSYIQAVAAGEAEAIGNDQNYRCVIPLGYRCAFSIDGQPGGEFRHLSISVSGDGYAPSPIAVQELAREFGFTGSIEGGDWLIVEEKFLGQRKAAINVMQKIQ